MWMCKRINNDWKKPFFWWMATREVQQQMNQETIFANQVLVLHQTGEWLEKHSGWQTGERNGPLFRLSCEKIVVENNIDIF